MEPSVKRMKASAKQFAEEVTREDRAANAKAILQGKPGISPEQFFEMEKSIETIYCRGYIDGMADAVTQYEASQPDNNGVA